MKFLVDRHLLLLSMSFMLLECATNFDIEDLCKNGDREGDDKNDTDTMCSAGDECHYPSFCVHNICPSPEPKADNYPCGGAKGKCKSGACIKEPCAVAGLEPCECTNFETSCVSCCRHYGTCESASEYGIFDENGFQYKLPNGRVCDNYEGRCMNGICAVSSRWARNLEETTTTEENFEVAEGDRKMKEELGLAATLSIIALVLSVATFLLLVAVMCCLLCSLVWIYFTPTPPSTPRGSYAGRDYDVDRESNIPDRITWRT